MKVSGIAGKSTGDDMVGAHIPTQLQRRSTAHYCGFRNSKLIECGDPLVACKGVRDGFGTKALDDQFGYTLADPVERAVAGRIFEWKNQDRRGFCVSLTSAKD